MKPQQQNTDVIGQSNVYVQMPNGEELNIPTGPPVTTAEGKEDGKQTAPHIPTTYSSEVNSGEDG